jgi:hypothetical protein
MFKKTAAIAAAAVATAAALSGVNAYADTTVLKT